MEGLKPLLKDMLMSNDDIRRIEVITVAARRRYWPAHEKLDSSAYCLAAAL